MFYCWPGLLKQIDAGGNRFVSGANHYDAIFCLPTDNTIGYVKPGDNANWVHIPGGLKYYSCGPDSCWGVNKDDNIFVRKVRLDWSVWETIIIPINNSSLIDIPCHHFMAPLGGEFQWMPGDQWMETHSRILVYDRGGRWWLCLWGEFCWTGVPQVCHHEHMVLSYFYDNQAFYTQLWNIFLPIAEISHLPAHLKVMAGPTYLPTVARWSIFPMMWVISGSSWKMATSTIVPYELSTFNNSFTVDSRSGQTLQLFYFVNHRTPSSFSLACFWSGHN